MKSYNHTLFLLLFKKLTINLNADGMNKRLNSPHYATIRIKQAQSSNHFLYLNR
ncbi:hypothetical protein PROSTU_04522 [Providencia stuartii ATCC 25827]|uniref:Uncharacterized protein n=1 Tax=Providencia stuartii ATCC 25827 TaxID=471874 RepID=A0AA86YNH2_PROST|nr:hypothetical protein PROSTU_04522 [Providencia stuartii ATCC 25827]